MWHKNLQDFFVQCGVIFKCLCLLMMPKNCIEYDKILLLCHQNVFAAWISVQYSSHEPEKQHVCVAITQFYNFFKLLYVWYFELIELFDTLENCEKGTKLKENIEKILLHCFTRFNTFGVLPSGKCFFFLSPLDTSHVVIIIWLYRPL